MRDVPVPKMFSIGQEIGFDRRVRGRNGMRLKHSSVIFALLITAPGIGVAEQSSGRFATHVWEATTKELPDGRKVHLSHYTQVTFADQHSHPMDNVSWDCAGSFLLKADESLITGEGMCSGFDADGDSLSLWWRVDAENTTDCPKMCGSLGYLNGTGRYEGIERLEVAGTWVRDTIFHNGVSGTWKGLPGLK